LLFKSTLIPGAIKAIPPPATPPLYFKFKISFKLYAVPFIPHGTCATVKG
jgi:hypothetical protein